MINRASVQMWGIVGPSAGRPKWAGKKNDRVPAHAQVIAQSSPSSSHAFYNRVIGDHKDVIGGMEIDFLWFTALIFPAFKETVDGLWLWAKGMSDAAVGHGLSLQYCMDLPSYALASMELGAVTNARASPRRCESEGVAHCACLCGERKHRGRDVGG